MLRQGMPAEQLAGMRKIYEAKLPVRHIAEPEELAEAVSIWHRALAQC
jgi:hypothetical protein